MEVFILIVYLVLIGYSVNILWLCIGFTKVRIFSYKEVYPTTKFSIIVPFRNENKNLPNLLASFERLNYPSHLFEVILVDDDSDDRFEIPDSRFQITLMNTIRKTNSPKKDAINSAIPIVQNNWVITTDADCTVNKKWLSIYDAFIQEKTPKMVASGVLFSPVKSFLQNFQFLDLLSLQGTTIGSFGNCQAFMCNGANLCYQKTFFEELRGFEGNDEIASGDDVFLLQKAVQKDPKKVYFLKNTLATVCTKPENSFKKLLNQRVRWASKIANYQSIYSKQLGLFVFLMNFSLILLAFGFLFLNFEGQLLLMVFAIKFLVDYILFRMSSEYFGKSLKYLILSTVLYAFFSSFVVIYSLFGKYDWKGRTFMK
ncbi:glycosyltransferase [Flavobacterium columnare]|uniref:Glycosyltransferase n=1 Tax=Flavobacterium columnare TaxID=996 RepID=A0AAI8GBP8_9FLAO|nr:glycosyltransferase [Flavobacterium columnare]AMO20717.1 glycosyltransferase [Flavobacterium columnare]AUX18699.1 glycosyltransferase [Flavobacterium columnare]QOG57780.1 glycosyltransferase [Flavobacterium columnare]QOG60504.1 glycosyltransferase [Flavobacterium columnare]QOG63224.1 glycosyltransferase [Flavobacterium columnare]